MNTPFPQSVIDAVRKKLLEAETHRRPIEFTPEEARCAGAFVEDALTEQDAVESSDQQELAFLDDDGPSDFPQFITTTTARELFDPRPGETVAQAAARKAAEG